MCRFVFRVTTLLDVGMELIVRCECCRAFSTSRGLCSRCDGSFYVISILVLVVFAFRVILALLLYRLVMLYRWLALAKCLLWWLIYLLALSWLTCFYEVSTLCVNLLSPATVPFTIVVSTWLPSVIAIWAVWIAVIRLFVCRIDL